MTGIMLTDNGVDAHNVDIDGDCVCIVNPNDHFEDHVHLSLEELRQLFDFLCAYYKDK